MVPDFMSVFAKQPRPPFGEVLTTKNSFSNLNSCSGGGEGGERGDSGGILHEGRSFAHDVEIFTDSLAGLKSGCSTTDRVVKRGGVNGGDSGTESDEEDASESGRTDAEESKEDGDFGFKGEAGGVESPTSSPLLPSTFSSFTGDFHL